MMEEEFDGVTSVWCETQCPCCKETKIKKCRKCDVNWTNVEFDVCGSCYDKLYKKCTRCHHWDGCEDSEEGEIYEWCNKKDKSGRRRELGQEINCPDYIHRNAFKQNQRRRCTWRCKYKKNPFKCGKEDKSRCVYLYQTTLDVYIR